MHSIVSRAAVLLFFQARGLILQFLLIYVILCVVPLSLGTMLMLAPRRTGNFLSGAYAIFPEVHRGDLLKMIGYRALGLVCIAISIYYIHSIYLTLGLPVAHFIRWSH